MHTYTSSKWNTLYTLMFHQSEISPIMLCTRVTCSIGPIISDARETEAGKSQVQDQPSLDRQ